MFSALVGGLPFAAREAMLNRLIFHVCVPTVVPLPLCGFVGLRFSPVRVPWMVSCVCLAAHYHFFL